MRPQRLPARLPTTITLLLTVALLAACAAPRRLDAPAPRPSSSSRVATESAPAPGTLDTMTRRRSSSAAALTTLPEIKPLMTTTPPPSAAYEPVAPPLASKRQADVAYLERAQLELQKSYQYTGLSDVQIAQQKNAESQLLLGAGEAAYRSLLQLNAQLRDGIKPYAVRRGDNLWIISARPEIYGNPWLWPLIWQNNLQVIPDPNRLAAGQQLKIRPNPTIQEVVDAVNTAREQIKSSDTRIGEVKEVTP